MSNAEGESTLRIRPLRRIAFLLPPTGAFCREDRCQSRFRFELIPSMRAPLEECEAAGAIIAAGGQACIVDAPAEGLGNEAVLNRLRNFAPDLVVLVVTFGSLSADLGWAKLLREALPDVVVGVRGAPAFTHAEKILASSPDVTFVARGEYEIIFTEIVRKGLPASGTLVRFGEDIVSGGAPPQAECLDRLPLPDRSTLNPELYRVRGLGVPQATVRVQRGCPFPCTYCLVHTVSGNQSRHRSPEAVAEEIASLVEQGTNYFYLRAETFSVDRQWSIETSRAIGALAPKARWVTTTRVDCVDDGVIRAMASGGCYGVSFGIDVGSEEIGRRVKKRPDLAKAQRAMRLCDAFGLLSLGYFMIGFAWETPSTLDETARFCRATRPDLLTLHFAHPYPGTPYSEDISEIEGLQRSPRHTDHAQARPALQTAELSLMDLEKAAAGMRRRHYADPRVLLSIARKGARIALHSATAQARVSLRTGESN
ncbi:MAG: radical SAM protein [Myxococcota bacterium]